MKKLLLAGMALAALPGCSSIVEGTSQKISVNTNPAGAVCVLNRQNTPIARIDPTPGIAAVQKTKYDITIVCDKDGYQETTYLDHSGVAAATVGNVILGGGIGWIIDSASGADNKYDSPVNLTMLPNAPGQGQPPKKP